MQNYPTNNNIDQFLGLDNVKENDVLVFNKQGFWINSAITFGTGTVSSIRLFVSAKRDNNALFYFNSVTRTADSSDAPQYDAAFMVSVGNLTTIKVHMRQEGNATNSTAIQIWRSVNGSAFSTAIGLTSVTTNTITADIVTLYTFSGLTLNLYDALFLYCKPASGGSTYYGIITIEP